MGRFVLVQLIAVELGDIAILVGVIIQRIPRHRIMILAHAEKAAKADDYIGHLAAGLVDHQVADRSELFAGAVKHGRSIDLVRTNEILTNRIVVTGVRIATDGLSIDNSILLNVRVV